MRNDGAICVKTFFERGFGDRRDLPAPTRPGASGVPLAIHANATEAHEMAVAANVAA